jgi:hypothetical protein
MTQIIKSRKERANTIFKNKRYKYGKNWSISMSLILPPFLFSFISIILSNIFYIFGAACPAKDKALGLVLPLANTDGMKMSFQASQHLSTISS